MDKIFNGVGDERKVFLPLAEDFPEEECTWLTIGIGGSKTAEEKFHKIYPKCKIYGAEPGNAGKFADVGTLISNGVGIEDGEIELSVFENKKYTVVKRKVISLTNLLDNYPHSRTLHYLTIDIEGYEHIILAELVGSGKFAKDG
uniref:Methyltransferase FkbM domain-containing protein n=1 Tax=Panagrolaimus davidi TaxID=227884 RepID=A0A914PPU6_9BILA